MVGAALLSACSQDPLIFVDDKDRESVNPENFNARNSRAASTVRGDDHLASGDVLAAIRLYVRTSAEQANNPSPRIKLGQVLTSISAYAKAEKAFRDALALDPRNVKALGGLGVALIHLGRPQEAIEPFQRAISTSPDDMASECFAGKIVWTQKKSQAQILRACKAKNFASPTTAFRDAFGLKNAVIAHTTQYTNHPPLLIHSAEGFHGNSLTESGPELILRATGS